MRTAVNHAPNHDPEADFSVTLSLVVTERDEPPAREQSVIDRARIVLTRPTPRAERSAR